MADWRNENLSNTASAEAYSSTPRMDFYLKIGQEVRNPDNDQFEFITLPYYVPLDTMKKNEIKGSGEFPDLLAKGNCLLDDLQAFARDLEPGQYRDINLTVRVYRSKPKTEARFTKPKFNFMR